jgi:hypothetical protein
MDRRSFITSCAGGVLAAGGLYAGSGSRTQKSIAAKYPNDEKIESDPDVLMVEGFEHENWRDKWQEISKNSREYGMMETDPEKLLTGKRCLRLDFVPEAGKGAAGWMHHWWDGSEVAYMRYYFKLSEGGHWGNQKIMQFHGHPRGKRYGTGAGNRPTGYDWFSTGTGIGGKNGPPWDRIILYTYFPGQIGGYGDNVVPNQGWQPSVQEEQWTCYEVMIKLNDIGKSNGEQRLWVNGRLTIEQTGMLWRKSEEMVINNLMQPTYTHTPPEQGQKRSLWLDNIVVAKSYIGPLNKK